MVKKMKNNLISLFLVCLLVSSCGWNNFRRQIGVATEAPDEFLVEEKKDLTIPKEFSLPKPGLSTSSKTSKSEQAEAILFGKSNNSGNYSKIEKTFEDKAKLQNNNNIRSTIENDYKNQTSIFGTKKGSTLERIVDPFGYNRPKAKLVDGEKENQRIRKSLKNNEKVTDKGVIVIEDW